MLDVSKRGSLLNRMPLKERHKGGKERETLRKSEGGKERETLRKSEGVLYSEAPSYIKESGKRRRAAPGEVKGRVARCVIARKCCHVVRGTT